MASIKEMMGMDAETLRTLGLEAGLSFEPGLSKSKMVRQLEAHQASGWMETNSQLLHASAEGGFDHMQGFSGYEEQSISDAARVAQALSGAGYTETFHHIMGGGRAHQVDAVHGYMQKLGVSADDVWMHLPKANPNIQPQSFNMMKGYLNNHWNDYQDVMPPLAGHYAGDIMGEYSTNKGHVGDSYEFLASMYLNKAAYNNPNAYEKDASIVATRLASAMGNQFLEVGYGAANGAKVGYHSILPQLGSDVVHGVQYPREPLNAAGLPLGSTGSAIGNRSQYSLVASLLGRPEGSDEASAAIRGEVSSAMKSLAGSYKGGGEYGMNPYRHETSEHDLLLDSATRYVSVEDARSGYANLDDTSYNRANIQAVIQNSYDRMDATATQAPSGVADPGLRMPRRSEIGSAWSADLNAPTSWNSAQARRESIAIANLDAESAGPAERDPIQFHNMEQGSQAWHEFRSDYTITGSTVGSYLGNNKYTSPIKELSDKIGISEKKFSEDNRDLARGHRLEPIARKRVAQQYGFDITEAGAITNDNYPDMMYSPDGLIGDNAIWEHKAPRKFYDLSEHPDYVDQMQLGMMLSGRDKALFTQTVGSESRSQWIDRDEQWFEKNQNKLQSILGRADAGRQFVAENAGLDDKALINGARAAMTGDGIWGFKTNKSDDYYTGGKRGMSRYSAAAGTGGDPFIARAYEGFDPYDSSGNMSGLHSGASASDKGNYVPGALGGADSSMALAVKEGILSARDEVKRAQAGGAAAQLGFDGADDGMIPDADFDDAGMSGRSGRRGRFGSGSGFGGGNGGGGGRNPPRGWMDDFGDSLYGGLRSGNLRGVSNGTLDAIESIPVAGGILRGTIGAVQIGAEAITSLSNYRGIAEDAGMNSGVAYDSMSQGLEMLGLNSNQANAANQSVHSAFNRMSNGDPSAAVQMSVATRGLLTLADVRASGGDPVRLAEIFRSKAQERGWSQSRIAGAAEMAGLDGFARVPSRSDETVSQAHRLVEARSGEDVSASNSEWEIANRSRALSSTDYSIPRYSYQMLGDVGVGMGNSMTQAAAVGERAYRGASDLAEFTRRFESNGEDFDAHGNPLTSSSGAKYSMQVLPSTARDPGYGIKPAANDSPEEYNRVGREKLDAMMKRYSGDWRKASAAYTDGEGTVDKAVKEHGNDWLNFMPSQAQKRVSDLERAGFTGGNANSFREAGSNGVSIGTLNVNVVANVNGKSATANANVAGQSASHTINVGNGAVSQRR